MKTRAAVESLLNGPPEALIQCVCILFLNIILYKLKVNVILPTHRSQQQVTCPQSTRSPSPRSVGALSGRRGNGRESGSGGGSGGSHPDSWEHKKYVMTLCLFFLAPWWFWWFNMSTLTFSLIWQYEWIHTHFDLIQQNEGQCGCRCSCLDFDLTLE